MAAEYGCWDRTFTYDRAIITTTAQGTEFSIGGSTLGSFYLPGNYDAIGLSPWTQAQFHFVAPPSACVVDDSQVRCTIGSANLLRTAPIFHRHDFNNLGRVEAVYSRTDLDRIEVDWSSNMRKLLIRLIRDENTYELTVGRCQLKQDEKVPHLPFPQEIRDHLQSN